MDTVVDLSRDAIRVGSKSFSAAARLFARQRREDAYLLYAWCRYCDDRIDGQSLGHEDAARAVLDVEERLAALQRSTERALAGEAVPDPVFLALQRVVERNEIPPAFPLQLLEGFAMDVDGRQYESLEDTLDYCYHVAGVVGVMMAHVMGARDEPTLDRASDLGIALQLTNIARDVMDDANADRLYLPRRWLRQEGVARDEILDPARRDAVHRVVVRLLAEADRYYDSASWGLPELGFRNAWAIAAARGVYREIGRLVRLRGSTAWEHRAVVGGPRKLQKIGLALFEALWATSGARLTRPRPRQGLWTRPTPPIGPRRASAA